MTRVRSLLQYHKTLIEQRGRASSYMLCHRYLKMSKSSLWIESNANVAVFVVFFFYLSVKLCCCEFVGKRCQAQALFDKILSHTLSLFEYFSGKSEIKISLYRDLWLIIIWICCSIMMMIIFIFGGGVKREDCFSFHSISYQLVDDPIYT